MSRRRHPGSGRWENPVSPLQAARFEHRWEQKEVCYRVRQHCPGHRPGEPCHIEPSKLSDYEHGKRTPSMKHLIALCRVYGKTPAELGLLKHRDMPTADTDEETVTNGAENSSETNQDVARYATSETTDFPGGVKRGGSADDDLLLVLLLRVLLGEGGSEQMRRDQFIKGASVVAGAALIDPFVLLSEQAQAEINHTRVGGEQVERLVSAAYRHARGYDQLSEPAVLQDLLSDWTESRRLLRLPSTLRQKVELTNSYARLSSILGLYAFDQGQDARAKALYETAQGAARESGDTDLLGWLYDSYSEVADYGFRGGNVRQAVELTRRGLVEVGNSKTLTTARLHGRAARNYAGLGDRQAVAAHLEAAERILANAAVGCWLNGADLSRRFTYGEDGLARMSSKAYLLLGDYQRAMEACRRADSLHRGLGMSTRDSSIAAGIVLSAAFALLGQGEIEGATRTATGAVSDYQGANPALLLRYARQFQRELTTADSSGTYARQFSDFLRSQMN